LLPHHDLLDLFLPGAGFRLTEWSHRCWRLDRCERPRRNLRSRLYFWRWGGSRWLAQRLQEFTDPGRVGFPLSSLNGLRVFRPRLTGSAGQLRRALLSLFLRFLGDACNQARNTNDRRDDDEDEVLIEVHGARR